MLDYFKNNSSLLKNTNHKITNIVIQEILSELMVNKKTSFLSIIALCIFYKKHIFIIKEKTFLFYSFNKIINFENELDTYLSDCIVINYKNDNEFGIDLDITKGKIEYIIQNKICLESYNKPLKGLSTYKVSDLDDMARKLNLYESEVLKKPDLYKKIWDSCLW